MFVTMTWRVLIFRMEKGSAEMDGSCEYIKQTVPDWSQMVAPQLCVWARSLQNSNSKTYNLKE